ncbi:MAG: alpha-N-acetylglucosaminidase, partial [Muribaculaceae bacterium]|nr:alpha-N-acetylglucosaminidase [Muribaculaceae bacterium]
MKIYVRILLLFFGLALEAAAAEHNPAAVGALLDRIGGAGASARFETVLDEAVADNGLETFVITTEQGKPCIKGSTLSALTAGIGWYLNHHAGINLSWNNPTADLVGASLPLPEGEERHTTDAAQRHYLNYCTFSYSTTPWGWDRWQQEIDWMALHGINLPLQIVGAEEVWRRTLGEFGYTPDEVNEFVAGPAYQAWFQMGNVEGIGGPNPDWWYDRQALLGRRITDRMRELGMSPVLPGIYFVPSTFSAKTGMKTYSTGTWNNHPRPHIPEVTDSVFAALAERFYANMDNVLGPADYYSMDPFHEAAPSVVANMDVDTTYSTLYRLMDRARPGSTWVIQHWQWGRPENPQWRSLDNVPPGRLLVVDLFADARPAWDKMGAHDVVYSTIFNFGGRTGLFGRLDSTAKGYGDARRLSTVRGIGATPEAIEQTPVIYDMLFELPWLDTVPDTRQWLDDYTVRRYGTDNPHARRAWQLIHGSALGCPDPRQGPHEAVVCARPALSVPRVSTWGSAEIFYEPDSIVLAAYELLDAGIDHPNYDYDLADVARQALTDHSQQVLAAMQAAHEAGDSLAFSARRDEFLGLILDIDSILNTVPQFMLGAWPGRALKIADEV